MSFWFANHCEEWEGAGSVICKYKYILGNYNQTVKSKGNDKKRCTGPLRRWPELRGEEFSCDQGDVLVCRLQRKRLRLRQGQSFCLHVAFIIFISLVTSHSVFRSPYNTVEGKFKGGQASSVFILKLFSYNSRLERIPSVIRKSDLRLTPIPRDLYAPKNPDKSICYQTVTNFNSRNSIASKFQEQRHQYKEHRW